MTQEIKVTFPNKIGGYWDGGLKKEFIFNISKPRTELNGFYVEVGSWGANFWFNMGAGKKTPQSTKAILSNALRKIKRMINIKGAKIEIQTVFEAD